MQRSCYRPTSPSRNSRMVQSDLSKSVNELPSFDQFNARKFTSEFHQPKSVFDLSRPVEHVQLRINTSDDRPVVRRKRFTRKLRKSVTIEPETGLILASGPPSSSDEEENHSQKTLSSSTKELNFSQQEKPCLSKKDSSESARLGASKKVFSASTFELNFDSREQEETSKKKKIFRGPSARRAGRRNSRLQYANAASANNLDRIDEIENTLKSDRRSMSVRDLNGQECDFTKEDNVTKWASQILAELDSLPNSCVDLTNVKDDVMMSPRFSLQLDSNSNCPPLPSVPPPALSDRNDNIEWMTSSLHNDWKCASIDRLRSSNHLEEEEVDWSTDNRMVSSLQDVRTFMNDLDMTYRDRQDSLNVSTIVGSSSSSASDTDTPTAMSPIPQEEVPPPVTPMNVDRFSYPSSGKRSIGVQGPETPLFSSNRRDSDENSAEATTSLQILLTDEKTREQHVLTTCQMPIPARRTRKIEEEKNNEKKENEEVRMRTNRLLEASDELLLRNIERLSRSMHSEVVQVESNDRLSQQSIPSIRTDDGVHGDEDSLSRWKRRAECRSRVDVSQTCNQLPSSVDKVLASLIRTVEDSRFKADDRPHSLHLLPNPQDVGTQTSPFSISRSSSFDWINDMSENGLRDLATPKSESLRPFPDPRRVESSSETDDADREVAEMTRHSEFPGNDVITKAKPVMAVDNSSKKLIADMEESLAMLLQYGEEHKPKPLPRRNIVHNENPKVPPRRATQEIRRPIPQFPMSDSIYDNMSNKIRQDKQHLKSKDVNFPSSNRGEGDVAIAIVSPLQNSPTVQRRMAEMRNNNSLEKRMNETLTVPPVPQRAGSCELLNDNSYTTSPGDTLLKDKLQQAEKEALECCQWLQKAGFPQYANQYEEGKFPIDLRVAKSDHEFLESDSLSALFRRLETLNRCAIMRIDNVVLRRRNDNYSYNNMYGCDDDDNVALSNNWQYQRNSHTWSRVPNEIIHGVPGRIVSTSQNYAGYRDPYVVKASRHSPYEERSERHLERYPPRLGDNLDVTTSKLQRSQSERIKDTAKALMKKMNPRSGSRRRRESRPREPTQMIISEPVLVSYDSASPESMRMMPVLHRPTVLQDRGRPLADNRPSRSKSARRQGIVLQSPSSPDTPSSDERLSSTFRIRERSVPPRTYYDSHAYEPSSYERSMKRERTHMGDYLYPDSPHSLNRKTRASYLRNPYLDSPMASSGQSSPLYSSPYSQRSYATPPKSRHLNIQPDGYFMHGSFDGSPDVSSTSSLRKLRSVNGNIASTSTMMAPRLQVDTLRNKSLSSLENTDDEPCSSVPSQNRRDSGVGSSLSRSPSGPSSQRIRQSILPYYQMLSSITSSTSSSMGSWKGTKRRTTAANDRMMASSLSSCASSDEVFFTDDQLLRCMDGLSISEMARLSKMAYLRTTAILEKYMGAGNAIKFDPMTTNNNTQKTNWTVQKLIKKITNLDTKTGKDIEENVVFGQPLELIYKRTGLCLPRTILEILRYLRRMAPDTVGMFRKNGVKSRIGELRAHCDRDSETDVFVDSAQLDSGQVHDVADLLKQYLRELPDPLMTARLSEVFAAIFMHVPDNESFRLDALQFTVFLLPDENREALQTLLFFLADVARYSDVNNMPAQNLSVCFTPSLFHLSASRLDKISANRRHKTIGAAGMPTEREMRETRAAQMCLTFMIQHCQKIFLAPDLVGNERSVDMEKYCPPLKDLGEQGPRAYLMDKISEMVKENADRWKGWIVDGHCDGVEMSSRKALDDYKLRPVRVWVDVAAPPKEVLHRIMKERSVWDPTVINWRNIDMVHAPDTDIHQYVLNDNIGHPTRDCYVVRLNRVDMPELRGACAIAERSVACSETQVLGGISATVLDNRFLIEPKNGYSRVTFISRVDLRGRSSTWYSKVYGTMVARQMSRLRDSFRKSASEECGPETKV